MISRNILIVHASNHPEPNPEAVEWTFAKIDGAILDGNLVQESTMLTLLQIKPQRAYIPIQKTQDHDGSEEDFDDEKDFDEDDEDDEDDDWL